MERLEQRSGLADIVQHVEQVAGRACQPVQPGNDQCVAPAERGERLRFRIMARRDSRRVRLYTRNGYNFADRFQKIVEAVLSLPVRSCFIDGEAIVVDEAGLSVFELLRYRHHDHAAVLCAFD
jgi:hypothetical protein